jgi:DNA-binding cell septation regulator SpoVG
MLTWALMLVGGTYAALGFGATKYYALVGADTSSTEAIAQIRLGRRATAARLRVYVDVNTLDGATLVTLRNAANDTALAVTVGAGATGEFRDTAHTVSLALDDLICASVVTAGSSGSITIRKLSVDIY